MVQLHPANDNFKLSAKGNTCHDANYLDSNITADEAQIIYLMPD